MDDLQGLYNSLKQKIDSAPDALPFAELKELFEATSKGLLDKIDVPDLNLKLKVKGKDLEATKDKTGIIKKKEELTQISLSGDLSEPWTVISFDQYDPGGKPTRIEVTHLAFVVGKKASSLKVKGALHLGEVLTIPLDPDYQFSFDYPFEVSGDGSSLKEATQSASEWINTLLFTNLEPPYSDLSFLGKDFVHQLHRFKLKFISEKKIAVEIAIKLDKVNWSLGDASTLNDLTLEAATTRENGQAQSQFKLVSSMALGKAKRVHELHLSAKDATWIVDVKAPSAGFNKLEDYFTDWGLSITSSMAELIPFRSGIALKQIRWEMDGKSITKQLAIGTLAINSREFDITYEYANKELSGRVTGKQTLGIRDLFATLKLPDHAVLEPIGVDQLDLTVNTKEGYTLLTSKRQPDSPWKIGPVEVHNWQLHQLKVAPKGMSNVPKSASFFKAEVKLGSWDLPVYAINLNQKILPDWPTISGIDLPKLPALNAPDLGLPWFKAWTLPNPHLDLNAHLVFDWLKDTLTVHLGNIPFVLPEFLYELKLKHFDFNVDLGSLKDFFRIDFLANIPLPGLDESLPVEPFVEVVPDEQDGKPSKRPQLGGHMTIAGHEFDLVADLSPKDTKTVGATLVAAHRKTSGTTKIKVRDFVAKLSSTAAKVIPEKLTVDLKDIFFFYHIDKTIQGEDSKVWGVGIDFATGFSFSDIPLVGKAVPADKAVAFDNIRWVYASRMVKLEEVTAINNLIKNRINREHNSKSSDGGGASKKITPIGTLPESPINAGMSMAGVLRFLNQQKDFNVGMGGASEKGEEKNQQLLKADSSDGQVKDFGKWFKVNKKVGPLFFDRVGIQVMQGRLGLMMDASFTSSGFELSLLQAGFLSPLDEFKPEFTMAGIGLEYQNDQVKMAGALYKVNVSSSKDLDYQFDGAVKMQVGDLSLSAIGSYTVPKPGKGPAGFFAYVNAKYPLGPSPQFYVTGLSAGFGLHNTVRIPEVDEVLDFPFIELNRSSTNASLTTILKKLEGEEAGTNSGNKVRWITTEVGQTWLAFGVQFHSYQLLYGDLLLIAKPGKNPEFSVVGTARLTLPKEPSKPTYVNAEIGLVANWQPSAGFIGVLGRLTDKSYIIDPECKLRGGFAYYQWYDGPHQGQFVFTIGGYHPRYQVPDIFPRVPRLSINWAISRNVNFTGNAYFALTPTHAMAGGAWALNYRDGNLKAWFTVEANFLLAYNPFYFEADLAVRIGASYTFEILGFSKTARLEMGVDVDLWGPRLGGRVYVDWYIISFTIDFGARKRSLGSQALSWSEFSKLLPGAKSGVNLLAINAGLDRFLQPDEVTVKGRRDKPKEEVWNVARDDFAFSAITQIPASEVQISGSNTKFESTSVNLRPMLKGEVRSELKLTVSKLDGSGKPEVLALEGWQIEEVRQNVSSSLFGNLTRLQIDKTVQYIAPSSTSSDLVKNALVGLRLRPKAAAMHHPVGPMLGKYLKWTLLPKDGVSPFNAQGATSDKYAPRTGKLAELATMGKSSTRTNRNQLLDDLAGLHWLSDCHDSMEQLGQQSEELFTDPPLSVK